MLNEERVKLMVQLASYEQKEGKEDFKVSSYYKKDYVSFHRLATMGYAMVAGLIGIAYMDQVLEELTLVKAIILVAVILIIYVIVLVAYWIASGRFYQKKHSEARTRVKKYSHNLLVLNKLYEKENM